MIAIVSFEKKKRISIRHKEFKLSGLSYKREGNKVITITILEPTATRYPSVIAVL